MEVSLCSLTSHRGGTKLIVVLQKLIGVLMEQQPPSLEGFFFDIVVFTYTLLSHLTLGICCGFSTGIMHEEKTYQLDVSCFCNN